MIVVFIAIFIAVVIFAVMRAIANRRQLGSPGNRNRIVTSTNYPRSPMDSTVYAPPPIYDPGPVYMEPNPIADIATIAAAEVVADVAMDAMSGGFDPGMQDPGGFDQGGFDPGGFDPGGFDPGGGFDGF